MASTVRRNTDTLNSRALVDMMDDGSPLANNQNTGVAGNRNEVAAGRGLDPGVLATPTQTTPAQTGSTAYSPEEEFLNQHKREQMGLPDDYDFGPEGHAAFTGDYSQVGGYKQSPMGSGKTMQLLMGLMGQAGQNNSAATTSSTPEQLQDPAFFQQLLADMRGRGLDKQRLSNAALVGQMK